MRMKVLIPCVGLVVAVLALSVLVESAQSRALTQDEMRQTLGKIGDGCPCWSEDTRSDCYGRDYCRVCASAYPPAVPGACPTTTQNVYGGLKYQRCIAGEPMDLTCRDALTRKCWSMWSCKQTGLYNNCKCYPFELLQLCLNTGEETKGWQCRQCEKDTEEEDPAPTYRTDQVCWEE